MRGNRVRNLSWVGGLGVAAVVLVLVASMSTAADRDPAIEIADEPVVLLDSLEETPFTAAARKPPPPACCDPDLEPGAGGNPFCFEGHTCCSDGVWRCNNPDATPSCSPGVVCDGTECAGKNEACSADGDCCSGTCKNNGRCR